MQSNNPRKRYSVDGFVPNNGHRRVGFGQQRPTTPSDLNQVRRRPPVSRQQPAQTTPTRQPAFKSGTDPHQANRSSYPQFTSYTGSAAHKPRQKAAPAAKQGFFKRHNWKKILKRTFAVLGIILLLGGGYLGWKLMNTSGKVFGDSNLIDFLSASKLRGEDQGRTNILLAGVSTDDPGHDGADLTDSIMLMSIDTKNKKAFLLSVPRDLWVNIPGYGYSKINAANVYGDQDSFKESDYPDGGIGLLEKTLSRTLNLPIHYHVKMNYSALRDAVNAVGGVEVTIESDDKRGLYDPNISAADKGPLKLANGKQTLDGQTALNLARARGDPPGDGRYPYGFSQSDFTRTKHQRMLMIALKNKVATPGVIANPIKLGQLFDALGNNVSTDFKPSEIKRLYDLSKVIDTNNIASASFNDAEGKNLLTSYRTPDGASALIPAAGVGDYSDLQLYLRKLTSNDATTKESPKVVVLNAGETIGLASAEGNFLTSRGLQVIQVGDAPAPQARTSIVDQSKGKKPQSKAKLIELYGNNVTTTAVPGYETADFIIILGANQRAHVETTD